MNNFKIDLTIATKNSSGLKATKIKGVQSI